MEIPEVIMDLLVTVINVGILEVLAASSFHLGTVPLMLIINVKELKYGQGNLNKRTINHRVNYRVFNIQ
ncbi:hypothetical protein [Phocaeicola sp.]